MAMRSSGPGGPSSAADWRSPADPVLGDLRDYPCHLPYDPRQLHQLHIMLGDMCDFMREHAGQLAGHEKAQQP
jgi:hypothetical protein